MGTIHWAYLNYVASLVITGIMSLGLGIFVLFKNKLSKLNQLFFIFSLFISIFGFSQSIIYYQPLLSLIGARAEHFAAPFISVFFFHFVTVLTNRPHKKSLRCAYILAIFWSMLGAFTKTIVKDLNPFRTSPTLIMPYSTEGGKLYIYYFLSFTTLVVYGVYLLYKEYRLSGGAKRNQLKYMLVGSIVGFTGGGINFCYPFKIYSYPFNPFSTYLIPIYIFIAAYAIVKHNLMDIKVALSRSGLLLLIYGAIIYICFQVVAIFRPYLEETFKNKWVYFPIAMYTILITLAPFLYLYLQKKMEAKIYKKQHQYQKTLKELSLGMIKIKNIAKLLDLIVIKIIRTVRVNYATVFLFDKSVNKYLLKASRGQL